MSSQTIIKFLAGNKPLFNMEYAILSAPVRHVFMMGCVWYLTNNKHHDNLQILEIGSWMGASALSFAQGLKLHNQAKGTITCIDAWRPFFNRDTHQNDVYVKMEQALETDYAYQVFLHNTHTLPATIICQHLRGKSNHLLPLLHPNSFDIIFIDGDHAYQPVLNDIKQSISLVKEGGIICGDDLNLQLFQVDKDHALKHADADFIQDPKTKRNYHPGVTLAVAEIFNEVSVWGGFWAMQKNNNKWNKISLKGMPIHYPEHFPNHAIRKAEDHLKDIEI